MLLSSGKALLGGGFQTTISTAHVELYDPVSGMWSTTGTLAFLRSDHTAMLLPNGTVLVAGGEQLNYVHPIPGAEIYDPVSATWSPAGTLSTPRFAHTATLLPNGTVLVAGGEGQDVTASAELYW
jgi:hypothetical protein